MSRVVDLPGAVHLTLPAGVRHLDPEEAVFQAMLEGWQRQQQARYLQLDTIKPRLSLIRRFAAFTSLYPWQWTPAELEAFVAALQAARPADRPMAHSTLRGYELTIRLFCDFLTDARYGWLVECERQFGQVPAQICHEWNSMAHVVEYEGRPGRRALTYDEVQALFDAADGRVQAIRNRGRKGAWSALRDAVALKCVYAFGLRRREACRLDVADFQRNARAAHFGRFGAVQVRYGKASRGSAPKRRTVLTVPEMEWIVELLTVWLAEVRPHFGAEGHPAVFVTERASRLSVSALDAAFARAAADAGLAGVELHGLRHSYVTHLLEFGYPPLFVQQQVGHAYASTTALYTSVSDEFRNRLLEAALAGHQELWEVGTR